MAIFVAIKLPKQWKYWCKKAGLKPIYPQRSRRPIYALIGHGYLWRVTASSRFERSCLQEDFDRWANSGGPTLPIPQTEAQFMSAVAELVVYNP